MVGVSLWQTKRAASARKKIPKVNEYRGTHIMLYPYAAPSVTELAKEPAPRVNAAFIKPGPESFR